MEKSFYKESGVDLKSAETLSQKIKPAYESLNFNGFAGVIEHPILEDYYLASTTDGIGSKILPLLEFKHYETIANDVIAMNLNDLVCVGATPIGFCDYISTAKTEPETLSQIIISLSSQLKTYGCKLLAGETSETKRIVKNGLIDIAGFAFGIVEKKNFLSKKDVKKNDVIIGLCSNGVHSNGFSLILDSHESGLINDLEIQECLKPTTIYVNEILNLVKNHKIKACCHITGGGIMENLKRITPENLYPSVDLGKIPEQKIFTKFRTLFKEEAYAVFNMGVGFCVVASSENVQSCMVELQKYNPFIFGEVVEK